MRIGEARHPGPPAAASDFDDPDGFEAADEDDDDRQHGPVEAPYDEPFDDQPEPMELHLPPPPTSPAGASGRAPAQPTDFDDAGCVFVPARSFAGERRGWVFKKSDNGMGYHRDGGLVVVRLAQLCPPPSAPRVISLAEQLALVDDANIRVRHDASRQVEEDVRWLGRRAAVAAGAVVPRRRPRVAPRRRAKRRG